MRGAAFGAAAATLLDDAVTGSLGDPAGIAVVALGSYARRELCPGSDVDVMLLGGGRKAPDRARADACWYPLWNAGFTLGHATRSVRDATRLADDDLDTLTALLDARLVAGDAEVFGDLQRRVRRLAGQRRGRIVTALAAGARARRARAIGEHLEPSLKDGGGGLRDLQAVEWAGRVLGADHADAAHPACGAITLVELGYLHPSDRVRLDAARGVLLDARVALHRVAGSRSDVLALQEQDGVAAAIGFPDADTLMREVTRAARDVEWISAEVWERLDPEAGPVRSGRDVELEAGVVRRDGRIAVVAGGGAGGVADGAIGGAIGAELVLRAAATAAEERTPFDRATLERFAEVAPPDAPWPVPLRDAFLRLLRAGPPLVPVVEALDHVGAFAAVLPEWDHVRARPQRNAYHRFTVDRHLLETIAACAPLLDSPDPWPACPRPDLLLLGALLHDLAKGRPGDHSEVGAGLAVELAARLGLPDADGATLAWLVRHHLLLAETAVRRDLDDDATIRRVAELVGDRDRLALLCLLTVADSQATGPAAWSRSKATLLRELVARTERALHRAAAAVDPAEPAATAVLARHADLLAARRLGVVWQDDPDGLLECVVAAPDRTGLLALAAGVLALAGFDVREAAAYSTGDGMALEIFRGVDRHGRLDAEGRAKVESDLAAALDGTLPVGSRLADRIRTYRKAVGAVHVRVDVDASDTSTVVEVHARDAVGLLARVAAVFAELGLDVVVAKAASLGADVVDVFYVRDAQGSALRERLAVDRLRATLTARLTSEFGLA